MNISLLIKCSYEKIFVANFAFFNNYNIFFIKLQMKKPSTWIGSDMPGPRRAAHVSEEKVVSVSGEERLEYRSTFVSRKNAYGDECEKSG